MRKSDNLRRMPSVVLALKVVFEGQHIEPSNGNYAGTSHSPVYVCSDSLDYTWWPNKVNHSQIIKKRIKSY